MGQPTRFTGANPPDGLLLVGGIRLDECRGGLRKKERESLVAEEEDMERLIDLQLFDR